MFSLILVLISKKCSARLQLPWFVLCTLFNREILASGLAGFLKEFSYRRELMAASAGMRTVTVAGIALARPTTSRCVLAGRTFKVTVRWAIKSASFPSQMLAFDISVMEH